MHADTITSLSFIKNRRLFQKALIGLLIAIGTLTIFQPIFGLATLLSAILIPYAGWIVLKRPVLIIYFLLIYLAIEPIVMRYLGFSRQYIILLQLLSEAIVYIFFIFTIARKILLTGKIQSSNLILPISLIISAALISMIVNWNSFFAGIVNVRTTIRFMLLYISVINIEITRKQITNMLSLFVGIGLVELAIGALQIVTRGAINVYLLPATSKLEIAGYSQQFRLLTRGREIGSIFGTLGDTVYFGLFFLVLLAIYLAYIRKLGFVQLLTVTILLGAIGFSFARAVTFAALLLILIFVVIRWGTRQVMTFSAMFLPLFILLGLLIVFNLNTVSQYNNPVNQRQNIFQNLSSVFSESYLENAKKQRLGAILGVGPTSLANRPLLGYGPATSTVVEELNMSQPNYLLQTLLIQGFEDVYWVAILAYYGLFGVAVFVFLFFRMAICAYYSYRNSIEPMTRMLSLAVLQLAIITPFLLFFAQVLEFRQFSFMFWLLPALMFKQNSLEANRIETSNNLLVKC